MGIEIERKFLVAGNDWRSAPRFLYSQGYLNHDKKRTVRIRIAGEDAWITVKGENRGATRTEFEYSITLSDAREMLEICEGSVVSKYRRRIEYRGHIWEVDEFLDANRGLVVAEIELDAADQHFARPSWVGEEVTHDPRYFNSNLSRHPYCEWPIG